MTTVSGTICIDLRSSAKESQSCLPTYSRKPPTRGLTDSELLKNLCGSVGSSNDILALATKKIPTPVHQLDSRACDSVVREIVECLRALAYREMRSLTVDYSDGVVTLRGEVTMYYLKQVAQESVRRMARVIKTINLVHVRYTELVVDLVKDPESKDL